MTRNGARREAGAKLFHLAGDEDDAASLLQPEGVFGGQGQGRDVVQRGLDRKHDLQAIARILQRG